jgi:hypothetical protein
MGLARLRAATRAMSPTFSSKSSLATERRAVQRHEQHAMIEILGPGDQAADFVGTQDGWEPSVSLQGRKVLFQLTALEHTDKEEAERRDMEAHGPHGQRTKTSRPRMAIEWSTREV